MTTSNPCKCGRVVDLTTCYCGNPLGSMLHRPEIGHYFRANGCECHLQKSGNNPVPLMGNIEDFHTKFGLEYVGLPRILPDELQDFRERFLGEEVAEYIEGRQTVDNGLRTNDPEMVRTGLAHMLDGLVDIVYVAIGTAYLHGFDFEEAWKRVHGANMEKVRATNTLESRRGSTFDVVKPSGWVAPDLSDLVTPHAHEE